MEVAHGVGGVVADVEHEAIAALGQALVAGHLLGGREHLGQHFGVARVDGVGRLDMAAGHHQDVHGHGRVDVAEGHRGGGGQHLVRRDLTGHDAAEDALAVHPGTLTAIRPRVPTRFGPAMAFDELERWAAGARARDAADSRMRERWLRQQATEDSSLRDVLTGLAAGGQLTTLTTTAGARHQTQVLGIGDDFVALGPRDGPGFVLVGLAYVASVTAAGEGPKLGSDDRGAGGMAGLTLLDMLAQASGHRPLVRARAGTEMVTGELGGVGADIVTLRTEGPAATDVYVALLALSEVSFLGSG